MGSVKIDKVSSQSTSMIVLFSFGTTMEIWKNTGFLNREYSYYKQLMNRGLDGVTFLTYGKQDRQYEKYLPSMTVLPKRMVNHVLLYALLSPFIYRKEFAQARLIKSNQSNGAWIGVLAKVFFPGTRFIVRCGWVRTNEMMRRDEELRGIYFALSKFIEWLCFRSADAVIVTTPSDRKYLVENYSLLPNKVTVIPNSVDTDLFVPRNKALAQLHSPIRLISIGRIVHMKNFHSLISAASIMSYPANVTIVGSGDYEKHLRKLASYENVSVSFIQNMDNSALPKILREHDIFVMPQLYGSGMSKVMIEAMACGVITMGSNIQPHRHIIQDGINGFLCDTDSVSISNCIERVLNLPPRKLEDIARTARRDVVKKYSLHCSAKSEIELYKSLFPQVE